MALGAVQSPVDSRRLRSLAEARQRELRDVYVPGRPLRRLDRVLICPTGVYVVVRDPLDGGPRPSTVGVCVASALDVAALLPARYRDRVRPVLSCGRDVPVAQMAGDVLVTSDTTLRHIARSSAVVLSTGEVQQIASRLESGLEPFPLEPTARRRGRARLLALRAAIAAALAAAVASLGAGVVDLPSLW